MGFTSSNNIGTFDPLIPFATFLGIIQPNFSLSITPIIGIIFLVVKGTTVGSVVYSKRMVKGTILGSFNRTLSLASSINISMKRTTKNLTFSTINLTHHILLLVTADGSQSFTLRTYFCANFAIPKRQL